MTDSYIFGERERAVDLGDARLAKPVHGACAVVGDVAPTRDQVLQTLVNQDLYDLARFVRSACNGRAVSFVLGAVVAYYVLTLY